MAPDIGAALSRLRHEKNISQREAARDLGVSQALLSHYENGVREPRLEFIVRACDYYGVSADFLAGRTNAPVNPLVCKEDIWSDGELRLLITSLAELSAVIRSKADEECIKNAEAYLNASLCRLLLDMGGECPDVDTRTASALLRSRMAMAEAEIINNKSAGSFPENGNIAELLKINGARLGKLLDKRSDI